MDKVIVERPRYGSSARGVGKGYWRNLQRMKQDELPKRERMKQVASKCFNEHLGPLRRYLRKQVGRSWNKIHSELYSQVGRDNVVTNHVFTHVDQYVAVRVIVVDGVLCEADGYGAGRPLGSGRYPLFYVCPRTGILKLVRRPRRPRTLPDRHVPIDFETSFVRKNGAWMRVQLVEYPRNPKKDEFGFPVPAHDALQEAPVSRADAVRFYGRAVIAVEARRASKDEIRKHCEPLKAPNRV